jgi:hypothetical protein
MCLGAVPWGRAPPPARSCAPPLARPTVTLQPVRPAIANLATAHHAAARLAVAGLAVALPVVASHPAAAAEDMWRGGAAGGEVDVDGLDLEVEEGGGGDGGGVVGEEVGEGEAEPVAARRVEDVEASSAFGARRRRRWPATGGTSAGQGPRRRGVRRPAMRQVEAVAGDGRSVPALSAGGVAGSLA